MAKYLKEVDLRKKLTRTVQASELNQRDLAKDIGIPQSLLSMSLRGYPITGKLLIWLGYERVHERLYQPITTQEATQTAGKDNS